MIAAFNRKLLRLTIGVAAVGALVVAARTLDVPGCATIQANIDALGLWAPVAYVAAYILATLAFVPGLAITLVAGLAFGPLWGTILVTIGANIGALLAFLAARYVARDPLEAWLGKQKWFEKFRGRLEANGFNFVLFVRLVPLFPFNGLNYACGVVPLRLRDYVLGSVLGMLPGTIAYVYLGATGCKLVDIVISGRFSPADLPQDVRVSLLITVVLLGGLSLLPLAVNWLRKNKRTGT